MKLLIINGPNINMLSIRETEIYGTVDYQGLIKMIKDYCDNKQVECDFFQSNHEGAIIDCIQSAYKKYDGIIINPAAYSHTSIAILDALKAVNIKTVEVHISDIEKREPFRRFSYVSQYAQKVIKGQGINGYLLAVDYFMWDEILPIAEKKSPVSPATPEVKKPVTVKDSKSLHDEIKEKLVAIGELLGFDSRSEVKITTGAVVDAVWEAKIGNMGKAIYVFEVQSKGSIDSLILNLKKAQSNAAVQAVVAVADEEQLAKIIRESAGVIDEKSLRTWDSEDVLAVYDSLVRAHESINKLALVPESF